MHLLVCFGPKAGSAGSITPSQQQKIEEALAGRAYIRALATAYVVVVANEEERREIRDSLLPTITEINKATQPGGFYFIMSPILPDGAGYDGGLPDASVWDVINRRTVT